jgi:hypothetical protein
LRPTPLILVAAVLLAGCGSEGEEVADASAADGQMPQGTGFLEVDGMRYDWDIFSVAREDGITAVAGGLTAGNDPIGCADPSDVSCTFVIVKFEAPGSAACSTTAADAPQLLVRLPDGTYSAGSAGSCSFTVTEDADRFHVTAMMGELSPEASAGGDAPAIHITGGELHVDRLGL